MIETSQEIKNIAAAILKFQGMVEGVFKGKTNPAFKSRYANLETVIDTARPALQQVGIMFTQGAGGIVDGSMSMTTMLIHAESGEWMRSTMQMPLAKKDPQGVGSAQTYSQRYSLMAILGLPPTDDDAETAIDRNDARPVAPVQHIDHPPVKSSAALKKAGSWEQLMTDLQLDMVDVRSPVSLEQIKIIYRQRAIDEGWSAAWKAALKSEFEGYAKDIAEAQERDPVEEIKSQFGGKVVNEHHKEAAE